MASSPRFFVFNCYTRIILERGQKEDRTKCIRMVLLVFRSFFSYSFAVISRISSAAVASGRCKTTRFNLKLMFRSCFISLTYFTSFIFPFFSVKAAVGDATLRLCFAHAYAHRWKRWQRRSSKANVSWSCRLLGIFEYNWGFSSPQKRWINSNRWARLAS